MSLYFTSACTKQAAVSPEKVVMILYVYSLHVTLLGFSFTLLKLSCTLDFLQDIQLSVNNNLITTGISREKFVIQIKI